MGRPIRKKRTRAHIDGDRAIHDIERIVLERGFALERTTVDYGTDFTLHVFNDGGEYIGFVIGQSRARRRLRPNIDGTYSLAFDLGHLDQWVAQITPFIVILYDTDRSAAYWLYVQAHRENIEKLIERCWSGRRTVTLRFPANELDVASLDRFRRWVVQLQNQAKKRLEFGKDA